MSTAPIGSIHKTLAPAFGGLLLAVRLAPSRTHLPFGGLLLFGGLLDFFPAFFFFFFLPLPGLLPGNSPSSSASSPPFPSPFVSPPPSACIPVRRLMALMSSFIVEISCCMSARSTLGAIMLSAFVSWSDAARATLVAEPRAEGMPEPLMVELIDFIADEVKDAFAPMLLPVVKAQTGEFEEGQAVAQVSLIIAAPAMQVEIAPVAMMALTYMQSRADMH